MRFGPAQFGAAVTYSTLDLWRKPSVEIVAAPRAGAMWQMWSVVRLGLVAKYWGKLERTGENGLI